MGGRTTLVAPGEMGGKKVGTMALFGCTDQHKLSWSRRRELYWYHQLNDKEVECKRSTIARYAGAGRIKLRLTNQKYEPEQVTVRIGG
jgi:intein-encoded DNA endonuclease-like protein